MNILSSALISELANQVQFCQREAEKFKNLPLQTLQWRPSPTSWSILECLEHLNRYGKFYLPRLSQKIADAPTGQAPVFNPGWLGNYAANGMLPKANGSIVKMPTLKGKNPLNSTLNKGVVDEFLNQQLAMLTILEQAKSVNLSTVKCQLTIPLVRFNLGDTLRFIINHQVRHIEQATRNLAPQAIG